MPGVEVKEMDRVRRIIADHMVMSKKVSPHVTNVVEVDVTKLVRWREKNKDAFFRREGVKIDLYACDNRSRSESIGSLSSSE